MPTFTRKLSDLVADNFNFGLDELDYPIFDETYRAKLNDKIIKHYWNYEIGQETESMFRFSLNRKMNEIMPYYNQLYTSAQLTYDPMKSVDYTDNVSTTDSSTGTRDDSSTNANNGNSTARSVQSDTPQVKLSGDEDYASGAVDTLSATATDGTATTNASHSDSAEGTIDRTVQGRQIPGQELLLLFRQTLLNIDMMVIGDLEMLFMQVWDNGDEFASHGVIGGFGYGFTYFNGGIL